MAAPNMASVTNIYGKTAVLIVTTSTTAIVTNSAASGKVLKVDSLLVSNINATSNGTVTVEVYRSSTSYRIMYQTVVPLNGTIDVLSRYIYLEEGDSLRLTAGADSTIEAVASYEEIS